LELPVHEIILKHTFQPIRIEFSDRLWYSNIYLHESCINESICFKSRAI